MYLNKKMNGRTYPCVNVYINTNTKKSEKSLGMEENKIDLILLILDHHKVKSENFCMTYVY